MVKHSSQRIIAFHVLNVKQEMGTGTMLIWFLANRWFQKEIEIPAIPYPFGTKP